MKHELALRVARREFLSRCGTGLGAIALTSLFDERLFADAAGEPLAARPPHFPARARNIIYLHMAGAPSQLDLLDYKPELQRHNGEVVPQELVRGQRFAFTKSDARLFGSPYRFEKSGQSGAEISELLPHLREVADDIAIVRSMHTDEFNHGPAQIFMQTGFARFGRPSVGSWVTYGLGTENSDLPGFVVLVSGGGTPGGGTSLWGSGFLPSVYQGVELRTNGDPVLFLSNPEGTDSESRRRALDALRDLNQMQLDDVGDPEIATRIRSYEMAYRMQTSVPELMDISKEPAGVHEMYGTEPGQSAFSNNCLLARRLVERGVRFVQLYHRDWDTHTDIPGRLPKLCRETDRAAAALVKDLKQRGLLDTTLVIWGGEFGRTPMQEDRGGKPTNSIGRDHHPRAFSIWMAGGGVRPGLTLGSTDDLGYNIVEDPVHVHDLNATILHLLGVDHERLTFRFQGRDYRLTDVHGTVVKKLLA
jgi:uncharacterized protein (DUF1501 family)